ncbi:hypothetical protein GCM10010211_59840 [Streptomyces albospinus]|uniref:Uncharacterized protein n=1 Tax=Streptomyces albospinus TaxID=285515 RepID=A0ABQ2VJM3_9ACTN|nr:hypothetical protein GCM10010211_59840 [Streptomyces albospinus]
MRGVSLNANFTLWEGSSARPDFSAPLEVTAPPSTTTRAVAQAVVARRRRMPARKSVMRDQTRTACRTVAQGRTRYGNSTDTIRTAYRRTAVGS